MEEERNTTEGGQLRCCKFCESTDCSAVCDLCRAPICSDHQSPTDASVCVGCFSDAALATQEAPLVDTDGIVHKGRVIQPIGFTYKTLMQRLVDYTEEELICHIHHVAEEIKKTQRLLDYQRIDLSASGVELEDRQIAKRKKLRLQNVSSIANGSKIIGGPQAQPQVPSAKEKALRATAQRLRTVAQMLGLPCATPEDLVKVAEAVKALGEAAARKNRVASQPKPSSTTKESIQ